MTNSMSPRDPDAIVTAWLEEGPAHLPETTRRAIAVGLRSTRQTRRVLDVPWRPNTMNSFARLALAAAAIVIVAGGAVVLLTPRSQSIGGPDPTLGPSIPLPSPDPAPSVPWQAVSSERFGYTVEIPGTWTASAPADDLPDATYPGPESEYADRWDEPVSRVPWMVVAVRDPSPEEALDAWMTRYTADLERDCSTGEAVATEVSDEPGTVRAVTCLPGTAAFEALVAHDGMAYVITVAGSSQQREALQATFDRVIASFRFAAAPDASVATVTIDRTAEDGYAMTVPASWNSRPFPRGIFFSPPAPITSAAMWVGQASTAEPETGFVIETGDAYGGSPYNVTGRTVAELLASVDSVYTALTSSEGTLERQVTIDGEPAWVTEHAVSGPPVLWIDAVVIHGDRAYNLTMVAPPESADELRTTFDEVMASIRWAE